MHNFSIQTIDDVKSESAGGSDPWPKDDYLNISNHFTEDEIMHYFIQICVGIKYLHNNNIIH